MIYVLELCTNTEVNYQKMNSFLYAYAKMDIQLYHLVDQLGFFFLFIFLNKLVGISSTYMKGLVGMEPNIEGMDSLSCLGSFDVQMIGIWGMASIGKTIIAKVVYGRIYTQFEGCCFLSNVREQPQKYGLPYLQMELLSQILKERNPSSRLLNKGINSIKDVLHFRKVLIILDYVDQ